MLAQEPPGDVETEKVVMSHAEPCLQQSSEHQVEDIGSGEAPGTVSFSRHFAHLAEWLLVAQCENSDGTQGGPVHSEAVGDLVGHVDNKDDVREAQSDELRQPEAEERDGGEEIVAHVGTTGLNGVAHEPLLLVLVQGISGEEEDRDAEEDHHYEPQLPWVIEIRELSSHLEFNNSVQKPNCLNFILVRQRVTY